MSDFYVEFEIGDDARYRLLLAAFEALREAKRTGEWRDDAYWLGLFDKVALDHFWWPTPEQRQDHQRRWFSTPVPERFTDPSLKHPWDFGSMIDAFRNGEYDLLACREMGGGLGRLEFDTHACPYGGTACMRALVEAFGHHVTGDEG
jgi:hypothetical protein